jgi:hypothetical protein
MHKNSRGTVVIEVLVIAAAGVFVAKLAGWKPSELWRKPPPTAQVRDLTAELAQLQAERDAARAAVDQARAAERARQADQVQWAQQMTAGAGEALDRQPAEHRTAETRLAADLIARGNFALALAVGDLPKEKRIEVLAIVDRALSGIEAERDAAFAALEAKDLELQATTRAREQDQASIKVIAAKLETKDADVRAVSAELALKTAEVLQVADKLDGERRQAGSLGAAIDRILFWVAVAVGVWVFLVWILPFALKFLRPGRTKNVLREISGWAHGALYLDAKKKIRAARAAAGS